MNKGINKGVNDSHQQTQEVDGKNNPNSTNKEIRSIMFAFAVVFTYFAGAYLLNAFEKLTFDNIVVFTVLVYAIAAFLRSLHEKENYEIIDFKEPTIGKE